MTSATLEVTSDNVKKNQLLDTIGKVRHPSGMAGKTITLDEEAYEILCRHKRNGQTFSEVVKEALGPRRRQTARDLLAALQDVKISEETLDRIEEQVRARRQDPPRSVDL